MWLASQSYHIGTICFEGIPVKGDSVVPVSSKSQDGDESPSLEQDEEIAAVSRRELRSSEMRKRLLDAAEAIFAVDGLAGLTNRRISSEADTTTQSIYTYFGSNDALLSTMFERSIAGAEEIISAASSLSSDQPDELVVVASFKDAAREYRTFCLTHPGRFRLIQRAQSVGLPSAAVELRTKLVEVISAFGRSGSGQQTALYEARVHMTISAIHGFIDAELDGFITASADPDRLFDELVHRCLISYDDIEDL